MFDQLEEKKNKNMRKKGIEINTLKERDKREKKDNLYVYGVYIS